MSAPTTPGWVLAGLEFVPDVPCTGHEVLGLRSPPVSTTRWRTGGPPLPCGCEMRGPVVCGPCLLALTSTPVMFTCARHDATSVRSDLWIQAWAVISETRDG